MRRFSFLAHCFVAALLLSTWSTLGCGGPECSDGTVEQDGECVLDGDPEQCPDGMVEQGGECVAEYDLCADDDIFKDGECVPEVECGQNATLDGDHCVIDEVVECGDGTEELDPNENECVASAEACGVHTAFSDGQCVPTDKVCNEGTTFDHDTGLCLPDLECRPGDILDDGTCIAPGELLAEDVDVTAEGITNPDYDGEPAQLDVPEHGEIVFEGTIGVPEPEVDDEDEEIGPGDLESTFVVFEFDADAGDWFEVAVYSLGLPDPMFRIVDTDEEQSFERLSARGVGDDKSRQFIAPEDGTYQLWVKPGAAAQLMWTEDEDWDFVGSLEHLETPEAEEASFQGSIIDGTLGDLEDNFYVVDGFEDVDEIYLRWLQEPGSAEQIAGLWASPTEFVAENDQEGVVDVSEIDELYLVVDWMTHFGTAEMDYEISASEILELGSGETHEVEFSADAGDAVRLGWQKSFFGSFDHVEITVVDEDGEEVIGPTEVLAIDNTYSGEDLRAYDLDGGDYVATFENTDNFSNYSQFTTFVDVETPQEVDTVSAVADEPVFVSQDNADGNEIHVTLTHDETDEIVADGDLSAGDRLEWTPDVDTDGDVTVTYVDFDNSSELDVDVAVTEEAETVTVADGDLVAVSQDNDGDADIYVSMVDSDGDTVADDDIATDGRLEWTADEETAGEITVNYVNLANASGLDVNVATPEEADTVGADSGDLVTVRQTNDDEGEVLAWVVHDATDEILSEETLADEESLSVFVDDETEGDLTVWYVDLDGSAGLDITVDVDGPESVADFTANPGDTALIDQENDDDADVTLTVVEDATGATVEVGEIAVDETLEVPLDTGGDFEVFHYGDVDGLEVDVELDEPTELGTFAVDPDDENKVVRVEHDHVGGALEIGFVDDDANAFVEEVSYESGFGGYALVGLEAGDYTAIYRGDADVDDVEISTQVVSPEEVTDFDTTYSGYGLVENIAGDHDFYLIELDETTTYELVVSNTGVGGLVGWARIFVYEPGHELMERTEDYAGSSASVSMTYEFEADTPYIIRIGNDDESYDWVFDYDLTFEEQ